MDTETKLQKLSDLFPNCNAEVLLDILIACDGSAKGATKLLAGNQDSENQTTSEHSSVKTSQSPELSTDKIITSESNKGAREDRVSKLPPKRTSEKAKLRNSLSFLMKARKISQTGTEKTLTLYTKEEIELNLPNVRVFKNFLPKEEAASVLEALERQKMLFKAKQFYIAGNLCTSTQKSIFYSNDAHADYDPVYSSSELKAVKYPPELLRCKGHVDQKVNEVLEEYTKSNDVPEYAITSGWTSDICVGNYYPDIKSHLDWHSDKLTNIGPMPTIASLTFGSTRVFRLRRSFPSNSVIYEVPLASNTLLVMLPSTQELFKHAVPSLKNSLLKTDGKVGQVRYNLTFRMQYPEFREDKVFCDRCQNRMILRRLFKGPNVGYYGWLCMSSFKGQNCPGFKFANFDKRDGKMALTSKTKGNATRWLSKSEKELFNVQ